jgi:hypothetical protein
VAESPKIRADGKLRLEQLERLSGGTGGGKRLSERPQSTQEGPAETEIYRQCAGKGRALSALCALRGAEDRKLPARRRKIRVICVVRVVSGKRVRLQRLNGF